MSPGRGLGGHEMSQTNKIVAAGALFGLVLTGAALLTLPFNASARAAGEFANVDIVSERIGGAFAVVDSMDLAPANRAVPVRVSKGDLPADRACAGETWPNITSDCIVAADGSRVEDVRYVTVDFRTGEAETVLLRVPSSDLASR
jgi:hypothetical protein